MTNRKTKLTNGQVKVSDEKPMKVFSPSELMRNMHPDLFSDSKISKTHQLPRSVLDYQLDTLTSRKQEIEFEHFARKLAEKEICPNLNPQTGPTGGGDSKVDTENYPVADEIAIRWYEGIGRDASREQWAFAISAKRDWRSKAISDIEKIVNTNRGYTVIYFITNQYVEDRSRAQLEDDLRQKYNADIRIRDRNWILKSIFENNRILLAIESLNITGFETTQKESGPLDVQRQGELQELEKDITDTNRYKGVEYQLVEDCLLAALLSRGLELPRDEVEGKFLRAERIAERVGHQQQQLRVLYNHAWTEHWWYEDFKEFNRLYSQVEAFASGSAQADDIELLTNLWQLLHTNVGNGLINPDEGMLPERTKTVKDELDRISKNTKRPNNALQARTNKALIELSEAIYSGNKVDGSLIKLTKILRESKGLAEYPITSITLLIQELGKVLPENKTYDNLIDVVVEIIEKRSSEGEAGKVLMVRGWQKLDAGKIYDAIKILGRAQQKLAMEEYRSEWVKSAVGCGLGYEQAGLLWAARSNMLMAINQSFSEYVKHGTLLPQTLRFVQNLIWIELEIGRVPQILEWMAAASRLAANLKLDQTQQDKYDQERRIQSLVLGILFLKSDLWGLKSLDFLPPVLDEADLLQPWMALLYALGYEDYLRMNDLIPKDITSEDIQKIYLNLLNQPGNIDIPEKAELNLGNIVTLHSNILGCQIFVEAPNDLISLYLGETILGALESFLATSIYSDAMPYRSELRIVIQKSDFLTELPQYQIDEATGGQTIYIRYSPKKGETTREERIAFKKWLKELVIKFALQFIIVSDTKAFTVRLFKEEMGFDRALIFSDVDIAIENFLGKNPRFNLSDWKQKDAKLFYLKRDTPWDYGLIKETSSEEQTKPFKYGEGEPPASLLKIDGLKHTDFKVISLINIPLWDKAKWRGIAYMTVPGKTPLVMLGFNDGNAGEQIFKELRSKLGEIDEKEQLRISIITGFDRKNPTHYRVIISANPMAVDIQNANKVIFHTRINTMTPPDLDNLNNFLNEFKKVGRYMIFPSQLISDQEFPIPTWNLGIGKHEIFVRPAWQIGPNDPDVVAIRKGDEPVIPKDVTDAPVLKSLKRFDKRRQKSKS